MQKSRQFASLPGTRILSKSQIRPIVNGLFEVYKFTAGHPSLMYVAINLPWHTLSVIEPRRGHGSELNITGFL